MVSLAKALHAREAVEFQEALERSISLIAEGIALHAVCEDESDYSEFQRTIRTLQARLSEAHGDGQETLVITGALLHAVSRYNSDVARRHTAAINELRHVAAMLTGALEYACKGRERATLGLRDLERAIEKASAVDDLRMVRSNLEGCLASLRTEIDRQEQDHRETLDLAQRVSPRPASAARRGSESTDPVTGLPDRKAAREALERIFESGPAPDHAVCLHLDRLSGINATCGYEAGNQYLVLVARLVADAVRSRGRLYRWSGPGFLVLTPDKNAADHVYRAIGRMNLHKDGHVLTSGSRSIMVGISISCTRNPVRGCANVEALINQVDSFVSGSGGKQAA